MTTSRKKHFRKKNKRRPRSNPKKLDWLRAEIRHQEESSAQRRLREFAERYETER